MTVQWSGYTVSEATVEAPTADDALRTIGELIATSIEQGYTTRWTLDAAAQRDGSVIVLFKAYGEP